MRYWILIALLLVAGCSDSNKNDPESLGELAALKERTYANFNNEDEAGGFMAAWYKACRLAQVEMKDSPFVETLEADAYNMSDAIQVFNRGYAAGLQKEPAVAVRKPLLRYVRAHWWKDGTGCKTILTETPEWALKD